MTAHKGIGYGALIACIGAVTSGPLGLMIVAHTHAQPPWRDAATFVANYHAVQLLPYFCGFVLIGGFVMLIAALHAAAPEALRGRSSAAVALAAAFAAMIFCNYAIQTTFIPALRATYAPADAPLLAAFTMANPRSLGWALEMWGYGVLGVATWLVAPVFTAITHRRTAQITSALFVINGPISITTAVATAVVPGWVLTPSGYWGFGVWNVLIIATTLLAFESVRGRA